MYFSSIYFLHIASLIFKPGCLQKDTYTKLTKKKREKVTLKTKKTYVKVHHIGLSLYVRGGKLFDCFCDFKGGFIIAIFEIKIIGSKFILINQNWI